MVATIERYLRGNIHSGLDEKIMLFTTGGLKVNGTLLCTWHSVRRQGPEEGKNICGEDQVYLSVA